MPPSKMPIPKGALTSHSRSLRQCLRLPAQHRPASTSAGLSLWRGQDPFTNVHQSVTGSMEWQTSTYSFNKQMTKTLPVATVNVEKLIEAYVTMKKVDNRRTDARAIRSALAARRKSAEKIYVSKPRIKDFGDRMELTAFIYDGIEAAREALDSRRGGAGGSSGGGGGPSKSTADMLLDPAKKIGLESLIARIYNKPISLTLIKLRKPHLDADILASVVTQRLKDRRNTPRRVIRDATWKAPLPSASIVSTIQQTKLHRLAAGGAQHTWKDFTLGSAAQITAGKIVDGLGLSQVSSVEVEAAGRLTKRLTANRSQRKMARRGANAKGPGYMLRGFRKSHVQYAFVSGKRRVGQFGIRVSLGHT